MTVIPLKNQQGMTGCKGSPFPLSMGPLHESTLSHMGNQRALSRILLAPSDSCGGCPAVLLELLVMVSGPLVSTGDFRGFTLPQIWDHL